MTDSARRTTSLAFGVLVAAAGFALDGGLIRLVALGSMLAIVVFLEGRNLPRETQFSAPMLGLGMALLFGVAVGLPKIGPQLVYHATLASAGMAFGLVLQRTAAAQVASVARTVLTMYLAVVLMQIARGQVTLTGLSLPGASGSSNLVSGLLLFLQLFHCAAEYMARGRAPTLLPLLSAILSIPMKGRSGIALLTALFLYCVFQRWTLQRPTRMLWSALTASAIVSAVVLFLREPLTAVVQTTRLIHGFGDESRGMMREQYLGGLSPLDAILGGSFDPSPAILALLGNPHNSFIRAHYFFGAPVFLLFATLLVASLVNVVRAPRERWFVFGLLLFFLARAYVDVVAFPGLLDSIFYYLLFLLLAVPERQREASVPVVRVSPSTDFARP